MRDIEPPFTVEYQNNQVQVAEHSIKDKRVFHITLKKPLVITVAYDRQDNKFWTSIPEGRQEEAEEIGRLIAQHIRSKR
jgi:hypothetical protein